MKKWLICLTLIMMLGCIFLAACAPSLEKEREISGKVVAVSGPFEYRGIEVVAIFWEKGQRVRAGGKFFEDAEMVKKDVWFLKPPDLILSSEIDWNLAKWKPIKLRYKITSPNDAIVHVLEINQ